MQREADKFKLQVEDRVRQMNEQRDEFTRDVTRTKTQMEFAALDYAKQVEDYRLQMAQRRLELAIEEGNVTKAAAIAAQEGLTGGGGRVDPLMGGAAVREKFVQSQLVSRGFTPEQMAAIMGSIRQESTFNPYAKEPGGTGLGLFQWS
jgi:hypothetical protein